MRIKLNGKEEMLETGTSVSELLAKKKIREEVVTVELNDEILDRSKYDETKLKDNDRVEFVFYMGGGI